MAGLFVIKALRDATGNWVDSVRLISLDNSKTQFILVILAIPGD